MKENENGRIKWELKKGKEKEYAREKETMSDYDTSIITFKTDLHTTLACILHHPIKVHLTNLTIIWNRI